MSTKQYSEFFAKTIAQMPLNKNSELHLELIENDHCKNISFQVYRKSASGEIIAAEQNIELPIEMIADLKRSIADLEQALVDANNQTIPAIDQVLGSTKTEADRGVNFAHESEREFARILDFYQIQWCYEPSTFAIRWDEQGKAIESFTPDFYLPEYDQYIEMTTLKQGLVTKKNRKVRLLRELYPDINIKIMYGRDYRRLLEKYSKRTEMNISVS